MKHWLRRRWLRLTGRTAWQRDIPDELWDAVAAPYPFVSRLSDSEQQSLRQLSAAFLASKQFYGAQALVVTDDMALAVAAQACLPLLHLAPPKAPWRALAWYDDFVGIVLQPGEVLAWREVTDGAGVVHRWREPVTGEAMPRGPVMLSWPDVQDASQSAAQGYNVVIHEFAHKLDLKDGLPQADGCPPLPAGFGGQASARLARRYWHEIMDGAFEAFGDAVARWERFGDAAPWLDPYGATDLGEFFAVCCEAYFVNRACFAQQQPAMLALLDAFFRPAPGR